MVKLDSDLNQKTHTADSALRHGNIWPIACIFLAAVFLMFSHPAHTAQDQLEFKLPEMMVEAMRSAMRTHPDILKADSQMQSAKSQVKAGEFRWYPLAELSVRTGESGDRYSTMGINQPLWDNGRRNADFDAAKASESVAHSSKYLTMQSLGIAAADAYLSLARAREQLLVAEANVNEHKKLHASVVKRNLGGVGSKSDASLATSRLQQARAIEKQVQGELAKAEAFYIAVIGANAVAGVMQEVSLWTLAGGREGLMNKVLERSPALQRLKEEVRLAEANVRSSRAQLFPSLFARVDNTKYFGSGPFDNDTRFSLNLQWQNDVALTQRYRIEAAQYAVTASQHALVSEERLLAHTATNYWADYSAATERSEELERFAKSAIETVSLFKRQFTLGRRSWPEVTNTLQDLYSAQSQSVEAKYEAMIARMRLAFISGEMDQYIQSEMGDTVNTYSAKH